MIDFWHNNDKEWRIIVDTPLKEVIKNKKVTIKKVAKDLNITYKTMSNYCRGVRQADHETLIKLSNYFSVPIDVLLGNARDEEYVKFSKKDFDDLQKLYQQIDKINAKYRKL